MSAGKNGEFMVQTLLVTCVALFYRTYQYSKSSRPKRKLPDIGANMVKILLNALIIVLQYAWHVGWIIGYN